MFTGAYRPGPPSSDIVLTVQILSPMLAHFSLSHIADPEFALAGAVLFLLYVIWQTVSYFRGEARPVPGPSSEQVQ